MSIAETRQTERSVSIPAATVVRPAALSLVPTSRVERSVAVVVIFFLAYDMPNVWMIRPYGVNEVSGNAVTQTAAMLAATCLFALASLNFAIGPFLQLVRQEIALPVLIVLIFVSSTWSAQPDAALRESVLLLGILVVGYWLVVRFPLHEILALASVAFVAGTALQLFVIKFLPSYGAVASDWVGVFKHRNLFGRQLTLAILVVLVTARVHRRHRVVLYGAAALMGLMLIKSHSKTSLVGAAGTVVMAGVFVAFRARRTLYGAVAVTLTAAVSAVVAAAVGNLDVITARLGRDSDLSGRTKIWETLIPEIMKRPVFGYGWKGFFTGDYRGPARPVYLLGLGEVSHAHNALLEYAAEVGFVGAGLAVVIALRLTVRGARVVRYYQGASGLFPLVFSGYVLITSVTEYGVIAPDAHFLLFVVAIAAATPGRRDALARSGAIALSRPGPGAVSNLRRSAVTSAS